MTQMEAIRAARAAAAIRAPYFSAGLFALRPVQTDGLPTMAVDERWRLFYNPAFVDGLSIPEAAATVVHELCHLLLRHHERLAGFPPQIANIAGDLEINQRLRADGWKLPDGALFPADFGLPEGKTAEEYARLLLQRQTEICQAPRWGQFVDSESDGGSDSGAGDSTVEPGLDPAAVEAAIARVQSAVAASSKGTRIGELIAEPRHQKISWERLLRAASVYIDASRAGSRRRTLRREGRREPIDPAIVVAGKRPAEPQVGVVIDTSASMTYQNRLDRALGILEQMLRGADVRLVCCDTEAQPAQRVRRLSDVKLIGGGGTALWPGLVALAQDCRVIFVLTDGATTDIWPEHPPAPVVFWIAIAGDPGNAPPWARLVVIDE